ncbi:pirin family protein [Actinoplanes sp. M2I2]|uniref:pirin family protein n=1 Tax=Actinoplanes sp. M2I2 TaxID=1734444 RepID=UPI00201FEA74|nr:pirin family protein [Actinoplanes sp. M2I2]
MSSFEADPEVGLSAPAALELLEGAPVALGGPRGFAVTRTLPNRQRRMVGAWCFLDAYGPHDLAGSGGMRVGPHPHTGLQTVTWLLAGEVLHRDSLGHRQEIRPGQLNLMTAGGGISHSEETPPEHTPVLQGVQLWVALPHAARDMPPAFAHHADLPVVDGAGFTATVLMGEFAGATSPARCHTPLVGAELALAASAQATLPLRPDFEYALLALDGAPVIDGVTLKPGPLLYLGSGRTSVAVATGSAFRLLLLRGEPFEERLVMWWNFVARDHDEIVQMRADWSDRTPRFGEVRGYDGAPLPAPALPISRLVPRGRVRFPAG